MSKSSTTPVEVFLSSPLGQSLNAQKLAEQLAELPDWEARYQAVIALGDRSPVPLESDLVDAHLLHGCDAQAWVVHYQDPSNHKHYFLCDSESRIVRGLLSCLLCLYNGRVSGEILAIDARPWMHETGLLRHLASTRSNGLWAMIGKVKAVASRSK